MNITNSANRTRLWGSIVLGAILSTAGCGGTGVGGSVPGGTPAKVDGRASVVSAAQGSVGYLGIATELAVTPQTVKVGTGSTAVQLPGMQALLRLASNALNAKSPADSGYNLISGTSLYYDITSATNTGGTILFSTDGSTNNAGNLTYVALSGTAGSFPSTIKITFSITAFAQNVAGTVTTAITDSSGDGTIQGTIGSSTTGTSLSLNLVNTNGQLSGTITVTKGAAVVTLSNISSSNSQAFTANTTVGTITGTITVNTDGSGSAMATDSTGTWTLTWDTKDSATLTSPAGQVTNALLLILAG